MPSLLETSKQNYMDCKYGLGGPDKVKHRICEWKVLHYSDWIMHSSLIYISNNLQKM